MIGLNIALMGHGGPTFGPELALMGYVTTYDFQKDSLDIPDIHIVPTRQTIFDIPKRETVYTIPFRQTIFKV